MSAAMRRVQRSLVRAAAADGPVLLVGESGTGRQLVARAIRSLGPRSKAPFIPVDLAAIPRAEAEQEVFGTEDRPGGLYGAASSGTLYLEALDRATAVLQARLVRALETPEPTAPRLLAASTVEVRSLIKNARFREDLAYRLSAFTLELPPLRERGNDILPLVRHFASRTATRLGLPVPHFSDDAIRALTAYAWPGNVRELESMVERLAASAGPEGVDVTDMPALMRFSALRDRPWRTLADVETEHITQVLRAVDGKRSRAAEILGIDRKTLREKLKRAGLDDLSGEAD